MEDLIGHAHILYDTPVAPYSPPLPPTPVGESVPPITYGSKTTKVATVLPPSLSAQDFTPSLPPRPNNSIHPSSRAAHSPNKSKSFPEKLLPLAVPEQIVADNPVLPSPISEGRNSVLFPIRSDLIEEDSPQKATDESQNAPKS